MFRIFGTTSFTLIQYINAMCNGFTIIVIYLICTELSRKYKINRLLSIVLSMTFVTLPLLSVFIYGDISSLFFSLLSVYFLMIYKRKGKEQYALASAIFLGTAYMLRMNTLIFMIASIIYLVLDIITSKKEIMIIAKKILVIIGFLIIVIVPTTVAKNYYLKKHNLNKNNGFPVTGWMYMGMQVAFSSPGWYNMNIAQYAFEDIEFTKFAYSLALKERTLYFLQNPKDMIIFYGKKTASMWTENTYSGIHYNLSNNAKKIEGKNLEEIDNNLRNFRKIVYIYQKALILIIFGSSIIVIWRGRKDISNELIFLLTIFIGGFLFQTMWEAKSRYIISYIVVLIPIASIMINKKKKEIKNELTK